MTVKDAATNSLLMFVAATCVVLIVRALPQGQPAQPTQAGSGGSADIGAAGGAPALAMRDGVKVYYLHGNFRCPTCRTIEAYAKESVESGFADELRAGRIQWEVVNYESPGNEHYATDYEVAAPNVVLAKFQDGKQVAWKSLPEVWEHTGDKAAFLSFVQSSLRDFIQGAPADSTEPAGAVPADAPTADLPLPQ